MLLAAAHVRRILPLMGALVVLAATSAHGQEPTSAPQAIGKAGDWTAYSHPGPPRVCFVVSAAKEPAKAGGRVPVQVLVSAWPAEGVRAEPSLKSATPFLKGSQVTITIGPQVFRLFTEGDRAWVGDATQELKLLEAMRKGNRMVVQAVGEKGAQVVDAVALTGLGQALQALSQGCK